MQRARAFLYVCAGILRRREPETARAPLEVTPDSLRLRKRILPANLRPKYCQQGSAGKL